MTTRTERDEAGQTWAETPHHTRRDTTAALTPGRSARIASTTSTASRQS